MSPDLETKMVQLWNEGYSASQVARLCGFASRNVPIGRINRLLAKGDTRITRTKDTRPARERVIRENLHIVRVAVAKIPPPPPVPEPDTSANITLLQAKDRHCRYIAGDPAQMLVCGHPVQAGSPYCEFHHRVCRQPNTVRAASE